MDFRFSKQEEKFRQEVRDFLNAVLVLNIKKFRG